MGQSSRWAKTGVAADSGGVHIVGRSRATHYGPASTQDVLSPAIRLLILTAIPRVSVFLKVTGHVRAGKHVQFSGCIAGFATRVNSW